MSALTDAPRARALGTGSIGILYAVTLDADGIVLGHGGHHDSAHVRATLVATGQTIVSPEIYATLRANLGQRWRLAGGVAVAAPPDTAKLANAARRRRDSALSASDYRFLTDAPASGAAALTAWRAYRQALRNLPAQPGFPTSIIWPTPPA